MRTSRFLPRVAVGLLASACLAAAGNTARADGGMRVASVGNVAPDRASELRGERSEPQATDEDATARIRRSYAHADDLARTRGQRDTRNLALDDEATLEPTSTSRQEGASALLAVDGDTETAWRGAPNATSWTWTMPFRRKVHLGMVRAHFGDGSARGVPGAWRWEIKPPVDGVCQTWGLWVEPKGGKHDDRDGNTFLYGPMDAHAQKQVFFADADACAIRMVITESDGGPPVLREVKILEGAAPLTTAVGASAESSDGTPVIAGGSAKGAIDGTYEGAWAGAVGRDEWSLSIRLPSSEIVDRLRLTLGQDAVTVPREDGAPGRTFSGSYLPTRYRIETSWDDDPAHLVPLDEADAPMRDGLPLPVRRRLVHFAPRPVKLVRVTITEATGPWGERDRAIAAPVIRELGLYAADDPRPVVTEPSFLSVDANPAALAATQKGGEASSDGLFARDAYHRLRRIVLGFDADSRWPAEASRPRDAGVGRFLEAIEGDDPTLDEALLARISPPPIALLSGAFDWDFNPSTEPSPKRHGHWGWDVLAGPTSPDRGMGQLRSAVRDRVVPMIGFCGGAQILALLDAPGEGDIAVSAGREPLLDAVLLRNGNRPVRGLVTRKDPYERAWWSDPEAADRDRPKVSFDPMDPLFATGDGGHLRRTTFELPSSHGDMIRASAFDGPLRDLELVASSEFCRSWVEADGPEPTWMRDDKRCVKVPQAFRSRGDDHFPLVGFQFHPEQRDLVRVAGGDPLDARGDALSVLANTIDLVLDSYVSLYWPHA